MIGFLVVYLLGVIPVGGLGAYIALLVLKRHDNKVADLQATIERLEKEAGIGQ